MWFVLKILSAVISQNVRVKLTCIVIFYESFRFFIIFGITDTAYVNLHGYGYWYDLMNLRTDLQTACFSR